MQSLFKEIWDMIPAVVMAVVAICLSPLGSVYNTIILFAIFLVLYVGKIINPKRKGLLWILRFSEFRCMLSDNYFWFIAVRNVLVKYWSILLAVLISPLVISGTRWF